jgi:hypothetical protein
MRIAHHCALTSLIGRGEGGGRGAEKWDVALSAVQGGLLAQMRWTVDKLLLQEVELELILFPIPVCLLSILIPAAAAADGVFLSVTPSLSDD